jgi:hypothetical protein
MNSHSDEHADQEPNSGWLGDALRRFNLVALLRERYQVRRTCAQLMSLYQKACETSPGVLKIDLYTQVVQEYSGADADGVRRILRRAAESYAMWPDDRDLIFRDIVNYFAVTKCRSADPKSIGVRTDVIDIVSNLIPAEL